MERQRPSKPSPSGPRREEEEGLVAAARAEGGAARDLLAGRFRGELEAHLARRMGPRLARFSTAEDLAQEALARALAGLSSLPDGARFEDFRGILLQHANWVLRDRGRQARSFLGESIVHGPKGDVPPAAADEPSRDPVTAADERRWLRAKVGTLDPKYARVLEQRLEGRGFAEIAARLGIAEEAARKRFARGVDLLRSRTRGTDDR